MTGIYAANLEDEVRAAVNCRICEIEIVPELTVIGSWKYLMHSVTNPNLDYSNSHT
jgi:hypothetical protein